MGGVTWSREEEKAFENSIAMFWAEESLEERKWEKIASMVPEKSIIELKQHYQLLVEDVNAIEAGNVPLPNYAGEDVNSVPSGKESRGFSAGGSDKRSNCGFGSGFSASSHDSGKGSRSEQEKRKGIPGIELLGYSCLDWKSSGKEIGGAFPETL